MIETFRAIGYSIETAIADIIDNSITAGADDGTTFLSTEYPDALLYACLTEGAIFLKEPQPDIANFENRFKEAILRAKNLSEGRLTRDEYRYDSLRINVS